MDLIQGSFQSSLSFFLRFSFFFAAFLIHFLKNSIGNFFYHSAFHFIRHIIFSDFQEIVVLIQCQIRRCLGTDGHIGATDSAIHFCIGLGSSYIVIPMIPFFRFAVSLFGRVFTIWNGWRSQLRVRRDGYIPSSRNNSSFANHHFCFCHGFFI